MKVKFEDDMKFEGGSNIGKLGDFIDTYKDGVTLLPGYMEAANSEWYMKKVMIISIENDNHKSKEYFKVYGLIKDELETDSDDNNKKSDTDAAEKRHDKVKGWSGYTDYEIVDRISKISTDNPVYIIYAYIKATRKNYLVEFLTEEEFERYSKSIVYESQDEFYQKLIMFLNLSDKNKRYVRMRYGLEPLTVRDGLFHAENSDIDSEESEIVLKFCDVLIPEYVKKAMKQDSKLSKNHKLPDAVKNSVGIRQMYFPRVPFGLPFKPNILEEGMEYLDQHIYGYTNEKKAVLQYIDSNRRRFHGKSMAEIYKMEKTRPSVIVILGRNGSGKHLWASKLPEAISYTHAEFDVSSASHDIDAFLGSSPVYSNSINGSISEIITKTGDNGCLSLIGFGTAKPIMKNSITKLVTQGILRDNSLSFDMDLSRMTFIVTAEKKEDVPSEILNIAHVITLGKMSDEERLVIGRDYMFPRVCEKLLVDGSLIRITDGAYNKICNMYRVTSSLDQIYINLQTVVHSVSEDYAEVLSNGENVEVTEDYVREVLFQSSYDDYVYDISQLTEKFKFYRERFTKDTQDKIEELFEEHEVVEDKRAKTTLEEKIRFYVNYVPSESEIKISVEDILLNYKNLMNEKEYGHDEAKNMIIDSMIENILAGKNLFGSLNILLYGAPGTGKTMLGHMVADILNVPFIKISLNGMKDPSILKGHSEGYSGATLGKLSEELRKNGPTAVLLFDELEKASLEVINTLYDILDPSEHGYYDCYLGDFVDTSQLITIATCNDISNIPTALRDRFKCISIDGYTVEERKIIARDYVIPKFLEEFSLTKKVIFKQEAIDTLIEDYIYSSSVREIEKCIKKLLVRTYSGTVISGKKRGKLTITSKIVREILGARPIKSGNIPEGDYTPGIMNCLAVHNDGSGCVFPVEVELSPYIDESYVTGSCKEMIQDSIKMAKVVVSNMLGRKLDNVAITMSEQAVPKDGPSAGLSIAICMLSAHLGISVPKTIASTGEIDLKGGVYAIGGLKGKLDAARQENITRVYIPKQNYDYMQENGELASYTDLDIVPVSNIREVAEELFGEALKNEK